MLQGFLACVAWRGGARATATEDDDMTHMALNDFSSLVLSCYRLSEELAPEHFQDEALTLLKTVLPFDSCMWGTASGADDGIDIHTIHLHQKSPEMLTAYAEVKHQDTAAQIMLQQPRSTRGFNAGQLFHRKDQGDIRDFLRRFQQENVFITASNDPGTKLGHWISLFRADRHQVCTEDERLLLDQLAPHVMQALMFNRVLHLNRSVLANAAQTPRGSAIADLRGVLYHMDTAFTELMRLEWTAWTGAKLPARLLDSMLRGASRHAGAMVVVEHRLEQSLLFVKVRKRCKADDLTERELTVARLVAKGATYKEIAHMLGRAPATVRNHIQAIYEKLAVNNIAGLIDQMRLVE
jgi:DNA-binding CsgD family transcriptional regulator